MVVLATGAAIALVMVGGVVAKNLSASKAQVQTIVRPAAGSVLRQDNPAAQSPYLIDRAAPLGTHARTSGTQYFDGGSLTDGNGPQSDLTRVLPTETAGYNLGWWSGPGVLESHGH
jgi:hypothetical protein